MSNHAPRKVSAWSLLCRVVGLAGLAAFFVAAFTPVPNLVDHWLSIPAQLEPADALVVLGAGIDDDGTLTNNSMRRALRGIALFKTGLAPLLLLSGPPARTGGRTEAQVRAQMARDMGVPPSAILTAATARTTVEEAAELGTILRARRARRILLVTDSDHMARAQRLFRRAGFEVLAVPVFEFYDASSRPEDRLVLTRSFLQEVSAELYYRLAGY